MEITLSEEEAMRIAQLLHWMSQQREAEGRLESAFAAAHYKAILTERCAELAA